ncbi:MAG TPA: hypothetical protein VJ203_06985 [Bacteroidales bacterium]|nr:hypothetical protein [Bacteroidales bacterium]
MENNTDKTERYFRERLVSFEQNPRDSAWENIAERLGQRKRKSLVFLVLRIAAGMAVLVSLGVAFFVLSKPDRNTGPAAITFDDGRAATNNVVTRRQETAGNNENNIAAKSGNPVMVTPLEKAPMTDVVPVISDPVHTFQYPSVRDNTPVLLKTRTLATLPLKSPGGLTPQLPSVGDAGNTATITETGEELIALAGGYDDENEKVKESRWILGSEFAPLYSYRAISSDQVEASALKEHNENESGILAYAGGIRVAFSAGRRLSVQSGVYYSRYGQEKNNVGVYNPAYLDMTSGSGKQTYLAVSNSTGIISSDNPAESGYDRVISNSPGGSNNNNFYSNFIGIAYEDLTSVEGSDITATQYFDYLEVPLTIKYKIIDRKLDFSLLGGVVTNFLVGNKVTLQQNGDSRDFGKTTGITEINYLGSIGLGFEYPVVSKFAFSIEPRFRYYLNPLDNSSPITVHPYSFGFFAGFSYFF